MDKITPHAEGGFVIAGVLRVDTVQEAEELLAGTGVFKAGKWPFLERRKEVRHVCVEVTAPKPEDMKHFWKLENI